MALKIIQEAHPESISSLAVITGRKPSNLSRTLKTMSNYGLVEVRRENNQGQPIAVATEFQIFVRDNIDYCYEIWRDKVLSVISNQEV